MCVVPICWSENKLSSFWAPWPHVREILGESGSLGSCKTNRERCQASGSQQRCLELPFWDVKGKLFGTSLENEEFPRGKQRDLDNWTHWFSSRLVCLLILFLRCCLLRNVSNCQKDSGVSHISLPPLLAARAGFGGKPARWIFNAELYSITLAGWLHCSPEVSDLMLWWTGKDSGQSTSVRINPQVTSREPSPVPEGNPEGVRRTNVNYVVFGMLSKQPGGQRQHILETLLNSIYFYLFIYLSKFDYFHLDALLWSFYPYKSCTIYRT